MYAEFLNEINSDLPQGVDWKQGAKDYLKKCVPNADDRWPLYLVPFGFVQDTTMRLFYNFVNIMDLFRFPEKSRFIDVGCGSGWLAHFIAKYGHYALGIDLCDDFVEIARERVARDAFYPNNGFARAEFIAHDLEAGPLLTEEPFDVAILESSLHHFLDPVRAVKHLSQSLKHDGIIIVLEGQKPPQDSEGDRVGKTEMARYNTLERAYTREQMIKVFQLAGFGHHRFVVPINGFFEENELIRADCTNLSRFIWGHNNIVASRSELKCFASSSPPASAGAVPSCAAPSATPTPAPMTARRFIRGGARRVRNLIGRVLRSGHESA